MAVWPAPVQRRADAGVLADAGPTPEPGPTKTLTNSVGMKLTLIPAGEFLMGSSDDDDKDADADEKPRHRVRITRPFYLGVTEVTQGQYRAVTGAEPEQVQGFGRPARGTGLLERRDRVLQHAERAGGAEAVLPVRRWDAVGRGRLSAADGGGMGVRLPGGDDDPVQLRRRRGGPGRVRLVRR